MAEGRGRHTWEEEQARGIARSRAAKEQRARPLNRKEIARHRSLLALCIVCIVFLVVWAVVSSPVAPVLGLLGFVVGVILTPAHHRRQILGLGPKPDRPTRPD